MGVLRRTVALSLLLGTLVTAELQDNEAAYDHLDSVLVHYDTLHSSHLTHVISSPTPHTHSRQIAFSSLGRDFKLHLKPNKRFSSDFAAYTIDEDGNKNHFHVNQDEYYHGYVHGEDQSRVIAHVSVSGVLSAYIHTPAETYHVEPSSHYLSKPHPFHMIAYKGSHVKNRLQDARVDYSVGPSIDQGGVVSEPDLSLEKFNFGVGSDSNTVDRLKRQVVETYPGRINGSSCQIILIADHTVSELLRDRSSVVSRLIQLVLSIDDVIYRTTSWIVAGSAVTKLGLDIREVLVHERPTNQPDHYNTGDPAEAGELLGYMRFVDWKQYCLAHLFTNRDFTSGLLGLANIASSNLGQTGGICSARFTDHNFNPPRRVIYNTGLTTLRNRGQQMLMSELVRVTGHELGHNWGSHHDGDTAECGARWLMYEYAQDGSLDSHTMFSSCSREDIGRVLFTKASCFMSPQTQCGDYRVEPGEECDVGEFDTDPCCTSTCMLREGMTCSDQNSVCCQDCQIAPSSLRCRVERNITFNCALDTFCNGVDETCPVESPKAPENTPCINGFCNADSICVPLCETLNATSCRCTGVDECLLCCTTNGICEPAMLLGNSTTFLSSGASCGVGDSSVCVNGVCTRTTQDQITRIWLIIINLDVDELRILISENIVGCVLFFSLPLWCLASCLIHFCYDKHAWWRFTRSEKEETDIGMWYMERINAYRTLKGDHTQPLLVPMATIDEEETFVSSPVDTLPPPSYSTVANVEL